MSSHHDSDLETDFELIDETSRLPELIRRPGLKTWKPSVDKVIDTSFATYQAFVDNLSEDKKAETKMVETHWPPGEDEVDALKLERWYVF